VDPLDAAHYRQARFYLGLCRYYLGEYAGAAAAFRQVAEAVPLNEVWNNLGAAQSRLNQPEALSSFLRALDGDPRDPVYHFNAGYALWKKREFATAADRFRSVLDLIPGDPIAMSMLGRCLKATGPSRAESRVEALERLKHNYNELAWRELRAARASPASAAR
jgi:tetratricopeptide (TPR) repeat protein